MPFHSNASHPSPTKQQAARESQLKLSRARYRGKTVLARLHPLFSFPLLESGF